MLAKAANGPKMFPLSAITRLTVQMAEWKERPPVKPETWV